MAIIHDLGAATALYDEATVRHGNTPHELVVNIIANHGTAEMDHVVTEKGSELRIYGPGVVYLRQMEVIGRKLTRIAEVKHDSVFSLHFGDMAVPVSLLLRPGITSGPELLREGTCYGGCGIL